MPEKGAGKSIVALPLNYVVIDTETTGLNPGECELIEVSALRVRNGEIEASFSSLIQPSLREQKLYGEWREAYVSDFISGLTGITNEMLLTAPRPEEALPAYFEFLGEDILLGHNTPFDMGFLNIASQEYLGHPLFNDYLDTLRLSRKLLPGLCHHRLSDLAGFFQVSYEGAHRSETDCRITHACYTGLRNRALTLFSSEEEFVRRFPRKDFRLLARDVKTEKGSFDKSHPLYGKRVAIAGELKSLFREEAMRRIADVGGINSDRVGRETDYLVIAGVGKTGTSSMQGKKVAVISEETFLKLLNGTPPFPEEAAGQDFTKGGHIL